VTGVFDIYWNRPFQIPALDAFDVSPEVLDRYVGVYTIAGTPAKMTVTREGATLYIRAGAEASAGVPLEATAEDKFKMGPGVSFEFDAAKGQLTIKRPKGKGFSRRQNNHHTMRDQLLCPPLASDIPCAIPRYSILARMSRISSHITPRVPGGSPGSGNPARRSFTAA
jgi:hypothetical protein